MHSLTKFVVYVLLTVVIIVVAATVSRNIYLDLDPQTETGTKAAHDLDSQSTNCLDPQTAEPATRHLTAPTEGGVRMGICLEA